MTFIERTIGCFFKFHLKVDVEKSIVNAPLVSMHSKNTNNAKSEVSHKQLIRDRNPWCVQNFEVKFKKTPDIQGISRVIMSPAE
jgi:hypothetical protein